ncbi:MAG: DUF3137 domain-containing protein, partial [Bacteroidota bacterium]|nr:DUF3137 domain-containing protein [Bacteroidota bacterium]
FENMRLAQLEKRKKGLITSGAVGGGVAVIGLILLAIGSMGLAVALIIVGLIVFIVWYAIVSTKVKNELKEQVMNDMLKKIDGTFVYMRKDGSFHKKFRLSGFVKSFSSVSVEDVFKGKIEGQNFTLGELVATRKQGEKSSVTVFKGPFGYIETSNQYQFTSIIPDRLEKTLGGLGRMMQKANLSRLNQKLIKIDEDPDFEKSYAVWTKDEQSIRQILTPQFRNYLKSLASMAGVHVGFRDNLIFFGLYNSKDLFKIKMKNAITESTVKRFYDEFSEYYSILENIVSFSLTGTGVSSAGDAVPPSPQNKDSVPPPPPQ